MLRSFLPEEATVLVEFVMIGVAILLGYAVIALVLIYGAQGMCFFSVPCRTESCGTLGIDTEFCGYDQDADEGVDYD